MTGKQPKLLCYLNKVKRVTWINDRPPVSVISVVAKVFEMIVYSKLSNYLSEHNIPSKHQSGFRFFHSTVTALLETTDSWAYNIDRQNVNAVVF